MAITCTLNDKTYTVQTVSARALFEIKEAADVYGKITRLTARVAKGEVIPDNDPDNCDYKEAMITMMNWFCLLFNNQFTVDDLLNYYPSDRIIHDITVSLIAVQKQATAILNSFPTTAATEEQNIKEALMKLL